MIFNKKGINNYLVLGLASLFAIILVTIILSINKGFDFTDEGGFLLSYKNVDVYRGGIYNYHIVINRLTNWLNPGILAYRWISILITVLSSFILAFGLYKWINAKSKKHKTFKSFVFLFFFVSIGNFMFYFPGLLTIYNNTLTNFFLQVSTGLILYLFSKNASLLFRPNKSTIILTLLGILCAFSFFIKFPTGILQVITYSTVLFFYSYDQRSKDRLAMVFIFYFGLFIGAGLYFTCFQSFNEWSTNFENEYNILSDHSSAVLLKSYAYEVFSFIMFSFKNFSWLLIFPLLIISRRYINLSFRSEKLWRYWNIFISLSILFFLVQVYYFGFFRSAFANQSWINAYFYLVIIGFQIILLLAMLQNKKREIVELIKRRFKEILIILLLLITPFIGAFGTANPIFSNSLIHLAPWFGIIAILAYSLSRHINKKFIIPIFIIIPGLVTTSQIVDGNLFFPYYSVFNNNKANFFEQTEQMNQTDLIENIYVDKKTKVFITELKSVLNKSGYRKGDPIIGFHIPGVIYLVEGLSPGVPYYYNKNRDVKAFDHLYVENKPPVIMVTKENPINDELLEIMRTKGIVFPDNYVEKGEVYFPNTDSFLKIYFPENY